MKKHITLFLAVALILSGKAQAATNSEIFSRYDYPDLNIKHSQKGFEFSTKDNDLIVRIYHFVKADARYISSGPGNTENNRIDENNFFFRNFRSAVELKYKDDYSFIYSTELSSGEMDTKDAFIRIKPDENSLVRIGKFKSPIGFEKNISDFDVMFLERSLATNLVPDRDIGAAFDYKFFEDKIKTVIGFFKGVADRQNPKFADNQFNTFTGNVTVKPFKGEKDFAALEGLGIGFAYSDSNGNAHKPLLGSYKSDVQENFFSYRLTSSSTGEVKRLSPHATYTFGPLRTLGEYISSEDEITNGANRRTIKNEGWNLLAGYFLTGEKANFDDIKVLNEFDPENNKWGAVEIAGRVSQLEIDRDAFPIFADPTRAARKATDYVVGINWYFNDYASSKLNYTKTTYDGGSTTGDRPDEELIMTRLQFRF